MYILFSLGSDKPRRNENIHVELMKVDHKSNRFFYMLGICCSANIGIILPLIYLCMILILIYNILY